MNNIDGLVYMLNQAGIGMAQAEQRIAELTAQNEALHAALAAKDE